MVGEETVGRIGSGLLVLLGVGLDDADSDADFLAEKTATLRVFDDSQGKMNLSVADAGGAVLAISQFTLYGDVRGGRASLLYCGSPSRSGGAPLRALRGQDSRRGPAL